MRDVFSENPRLFLIAVIAIITIMFLSSCYVDRKGQLTTKGENFIADHCKGETKTEVVFKTSTKDSLVYRDVIGPTQYLESPCKDLCDSLGNLKKFEIVKKKNGLKSTIKSVGNSIEADCEADSLKDVIKIITNELNTLKSEKTVIKAPCDKEHITGWDQYWIKTGYILVAFMVLQILLKIITSIYPVTKPFLGFAYLFKF